MQKIHVGVIGLGQIAYGIDADKKRKIIWSHIGCYQKNLHTKVIAVAETNQSLLQKVVVAIKVKYAYVDYKKMLQENNLTIVSICTPIKTHVGIIEECLKYPNIKVIFCEKTLDFDYQKAKKIVEKCQQKNVLLVVNHSLRWDSRIREIKLTIDSNILGKVLSVVAYSNTSLFTSASHVIDLINYLLNNPKTVRGYQQENFIRNVHGVPDPGANALIKYDDAIAFLKATSKDDKHLMFELDVEFELGRIRFYDNFTKLELYRFEKNLENNYYELKMELGKNIKQNQRNLEVINDIVTYLKTGKNQILSTGLTSLLTIKIINKILMSSKLQKELKI